MPSPIGENEALKTALLQLRSNDVLLQNEGVATVIRIGAAAVPALLLLLEDGEAGRRAQVMYALAQIAEPGTTEAFQHGLGNQDKRVRAYAAVGLARIEHPDALTACLQTLNDAPNPLHADMTPAVLALGQMGMRVVPALLDLLMDDHEFTRLHAQRALEMILDQRHGFYPGQGFPTPEAEEQARAEWKDNGGYDYSADAATRAAAVAKWQRWLETAEK